jgi:hypothetical protein
MKAQTVATIPLPHDWTIKTWPRDVYPYDGLKARHLLRVNQAKLLAAGALTRIGHEIVVLGAGYAKWLASNAVRVSAEYDVASNRPEHQHKRFGRDKAGASVQVSRAEIDAALKPSPKA